jgi:deoxycytidine triphosphate deaminase
VILSDREIEAALHYGHIRIEPRPAPELWTSTAIDLTLKMYAANSQWKGIK